MKTRSEPKSMHIDVNVSQFLFTETQRLRSHHLVFSEKRVPPKWEALAVGRSVTGCPRSFLSQRKGQVQSVSMAHSGLQWLLHIDHLCTGKILKVDPFKNSTVTLGFRPDSQGHLECFSHSTDEAGTLEIVHLTWRAGLGIRPRIDSSICE